MDELHVYTMVRAHTFSKKLEVSTKTLMSEQWHNGNP